MKTVTTEDFLSFSANDFKVPYEKIVQEHAAFDKLIAEWMKPKRIKSRC